MNQTDIAHLVDRIRWGRPTIVLGTMPPLPRAIATIRVRCDLPGTLGPLDRARDRIERLLDGDAYERKRGGGGGGSGGAAGGGGSGSSRDTVAARHRAISAAGETANVAAAAPMSVEERFTAACNRLAARAPGSVALILEGIDAADAATHKALARVLSGRRSGSGGGGARSTLLLLPLIMVLRDKPRGSFLEVVEALAEGSQLRGQDVKEAFARPSMAPTATANEEPSQRQTWAPQQHAPQRVDAASTVSGGSEGADVRLDKLDRQALRVLRAASTIGHTFEALLVASLLDLTIEDVLEALQRARDLGVPIQDDGMGHFEMPTDLTHTLASSVLPSLRRHWHELLGELLGDTTGGLTTEAGTAATPDPLRSAAHLEDAGQRDRALQRRLEGVAMLIRCGDVERAAAELGSASTEIASLPRGSFTAGLRARAKLERSRLRWLGAGLEASFTLDGALENALEARSELGEMATAAVRADIASMVAGIAYDLGDGASLERAEKVLSETIASFLNEGSNVEAATLLNDQAAVQLRMGRVIRALDMLGRSLEILTTHVNETPTDAGARADLAETHHLLARMPLHVTSRDRVSDGDRNGKGKDDANDARSIPRALSHAREAETTYRAFGMRRDLARVTETIARLEAKRGNAEAARSAFSAAMQLADEVADLTGLARITAGLAELLTAAGTPRDALGMLASSIELNREKGSPIGLAFDERILDEVQRTVELMPSVEPGLRDELARTRARLVAALEATSS